MTRTDYLLILEQELVGLQPTARQEVLDYFREYFEETGDDQKAIQDLGTPQEAAQEIIANLPSDELVQEASRPIADEVQNKIDFSFDWKDFFKQFHHRKGNQMSLPVSLPDFKQLKLELQDVSFVIQTAEQNQASIRYNHIDDEGANIDFSYQVEGDCLLLQAKGHEHPTSDSNRNIAILTLPQGALSISSLTFTLLDSQLTVSDLELASLLSLESRDSNLSLRNLTIQQLSLLDLVDTNLTLANIRARKVKMDCSDTNLTIKESNFDLLTATLADCNFILDHCQLGKSFLDLGDCIWNAKQFSMTDQLVCHADDSFLTLQPSFPCNVQLEAEESVIQLPQEMQALLHWREDEAYLDYQTTDSSGTLLVHCDDCHLTIV